MPKLTKRFVDSVKTGTRDVVLWDSELPRFGLRVKRSGAKTYIVQYRNAVGRTRKLAVGRVGELTPEKPAAWLRTRWATFAKARIHLQAGRPPAVERP